MGRTLIPRYLAAIELSTLDDTELHTLAGGIAVAAKTSALVLASPTLQTSVAALATKDGNLTVANQTVTADKIKLNADTAAEAVVRTVLVGELRIYATGASNAATSEADLHGAGLTPLGPRTPRNTPPTVPVEINTTFPRVGHGKATVSVQETGSARNKYAAQQSVDGVTWTQLGVSQGKTRAVTGASGAKIWVRFAMVRGSLQSDWSIPVLVTLP
jgi:hypothetical protein